MLSKAEGTTTSATVSHTGNKEKAIEFIKGTRCRIQCTRNKIIEVSRVSRRDYLNITGSEENILLMVVKSVLGLISHDKK